MKLHITNNIYILYRLILLTYFVYVLVYLYTAEICISIYFIFIHQNVFLLFLSWNLKKIIERQVFLSFSFKLTPLQEMTSYWKQQQVLAIHHTSFIWNNGNITASNTCVFLTNWFNREININTIHVNLQFSCTV